MKKSTIIPLLLLVCACVGAQNRISGKSIFQTDIVIKNNKITKTIHCSLLIANLDDESKTNISIQSNKLCKVSNIKASIEDLSGHVIKELSGKDIETHSEFETYSFYDDNMVHEFSLKHNTYPYLFKYSYEISENQFLFVDTWSPLTSFYNTTDYSELNVSIPKDYHIKYKYSPGIKFNVDSTENEYKYRWYGSNQPLPERELFQPDITNIIPSVTIVPEKFVYGNPGSFDSWKSYGNWSYNTISGLQNLPYSETSNILSLTEDCADTLQKIKKIYNYLQDYTRYINIYEKTGGMIPSPASYVSTNKYGDCKALANYMIALLKTIKVRAIYAKINAGDPIVAIDKKFPSQQSNHVIVCVPFHSDSIWLDCTSKNPFRYCGTFIQGRDVLLIEPDNTHFTHVPSLKKEDVLELRKIRVDQNMGNTTEVTFDNSYKGDTYEEASEIVTHNMQDQEKYIKKHILGNEYTLNHFEIIKANRDSTTIQLRINSASQKIYNSYGNDLILKPISIEIPKFKRKLSRKYDVQINFPIYKKDIQEYKLTATQKPVKLPSPRNIESKYGHYNINYELNKDVILVKKEFLLNSGYYPLANYPELYSFIEQVSESENNEGIEIINK